MIFSRSLFCFCSVILPLIFGNKVTWNSHVLAKLHLVEHSGKQNHRSQCWITICKLPWKQLKAVSLPLSSTERKWVGANRNWQYWGHFYFSSTLDQHATHFTLTHHSLLNASSSEMIFLRASQNVVQVNCSKPRPVIQRLDTGRVYVLSSTIHRDLLVLPSVRNTGSWRWPGRTGRPRSLWSSRG